MLHLTIDLAVLIVAILTGFITYRKTNPLYLKLFPFFLLLILLVELAGELYQQPGQNNLPIYNLFAVIEFFFFTYFFREAIPRNRGTYIINIMMYLLPALCVVNALLVQGLFVFNTYTFILGALVMVALGITFFYRLFKSAERVDLLREPAFWISIGIIFFFTCALSVVGALNYIASLPKVVRYNLQKIQLLVSAFFYTIFIIAFLCQINTRKLLSRP